MAGIAFFAAAGGLETDVYVTFSARAKSSLLIAAVSLTLLGLIAFDSVLWKAGDRVLSGLGTVAYVVAAVSWVVAEGRALALHEWTYGLEAAFIVAAGVSMLTFGAAVIRTGAIPRWVGWLAVVWSAGSLIMFALPHQGYPPMAPQLVPLLFGVALLRSTRSLPPIH
jgi:hypothetical protein